MDANPTLPVLDKASLLRSQPASGMARRRHCSNAVMGYDRFHVPCGSQVRTCGDGPNAGRSGQLETGRPDGPEGDRGQSLAAAAQYPQPQAHAGGQAVQQQGADTSAD